MNRFRIGAALLVILLAGSLSVQWGMNGIFAPASAALEQAAALGAGGNWPRAADCVRQADARWRRYRHISAVFADHQPMEDIDSQLARLAVYAAARETAEFTAASRELARRMDAMADAHRLNWWNFL